jgi:YaiO family outer membrane protein
VKKNVLKEYRCSKIYFKMKHIRIYFFVVLLFSQALAIFSQNSIMPDDKKALIDKVLVINQDSSIAKARVFIKEQKFDTARTQLKPLIDSTYHNVDAMLLYGRICLWQSKWDTARVVLNNALQLAPRYLDVIQALIDAENWSGNNDKALFYAEYGLFFYPGNEDLMLHKAKVLIALNRDHEAVFTLRELLKKNPLNADATKLLTDLQQKVFFSKLSLEYLYEGYSIPVIYNWHLLSLAYEKQFKWGTFVARINEGDKVPTGEYFGSNQVAYQLEVDAYPKIGKTDYLHLNYAYSAHQIFPHDRLGAEWYHIFLPKAEASLGIRYMYYSNDLALPFGVWAYTGSYTKYFSKFMFSGRVYLTPLGQNVNTALVLTLRRYLKNPLNYLFASFISGNSPDDASKNIYGVATSTFPVIMFKAGCQVMVSPKQYVYLSAGVGSEQYNNIPLFRDVYDVELRTGFFF